jgi:hypothetical protein
LPRLVDHLTPLYHAEPGLITSSFGSVLFAILAYLISGPWAFEFLLCRVEALQSGAIHPAPWNEIHFDWEWIPERVENTVAIFLKHLSAVAILAIEFERNTAFCETQNIRYPAAAVASRTTPILHVEAGEEKCISIESSAEVLD